MCLLLFYPFTAESPESCGQTSVSVFVQQEQDLELRAKLSVLMYSNSLQDM